MCLEYSPKVVVRSYSCLKRWLWCICYMAATESTAREDVRRNTNFAVHVGKHDDMNEVLGPPYLASLPRLVLRGYSAGWHSVIRARGQYPQGSRPRAPQRGVRDNSRCLRSRRAGIFA
ncbi:hypothetical protein KC19_VG044200 [Ceratodon purpureus]|uniref:Uncharacterized protein n=1 Tax=Ceratodon purpureus TaxID=3225 RepID=A0A8T0HLY0_CERPU|nr:hypothetical protein KC19_VG044200 [Ceratodon purpureus]